MGAPSVHQVALACGAAGAYVDVSAYVLSDRTITQKWGRESSFEDVRPRALSFPLNNEDGRFTPDNPNSPLATTLVEGMGVSWLVGTRLVHGTIRALTPSFDSMLATSARMQVTADDVLGNASRAALDDLIEAAEVAAGRYLGWRMDDPAGSSKAAESSGGLPIFPFYGGSGTFGVAAIPGVDSTQFEGSLINIRNNPSSTLTPTISYAAGSMGAWGFWVTPVSGTPDFSFEVYVNGLAASFSMTIAGDVVSCFSGVTGDSYVFPVLLGVPHYLSMVITNTSPTAITGMFYLDGNLIKTLVYAGGGSVPTNAAKTPLSVAINLGLFSGSVTRVSRVLHSASVVNEEGAIGASESSRLNFLADTVAGLNLNTLPKLSSAPLGAIRPSGSVLDMLNEVIKTEQGHLYTTTAGTLTAPVEKVTIRGRDRPTTVSATFSVLNDIVDAPEFVRTLNNALYQVKVSGPDNSVVVRDLTLVQRAGSGQESVLLENVADLRAWGQDRLIRSKTAGVAIVSFTVDAFTTTSDRWATLAALKPGDRLQVSDLPSTQLGFATWDCWIVGGSESHTEESHLFTFYVMPVQAPVAKYGTARYMSGGELSLSSSVTSTATSWSVATTKTKLSTTAVPYTLVVDSEQVTVTACTGATPQVLTVTRHVNGTAAAAHSSGANVEIALPAIYGF